MGEESSVRRFVQDVPAGAVHQVIPGAGMIHPSMGALLAGFGMASAGIFLPGRRPLASAVYGAGGATTAWNGVAMAGQDQTGGGHGERALAPMHRGPWTDEEDDILKEKVREHGDRKWAAVAQFLPGRIGKQCRERWTNHLRPDIKKSLWTEEDDIALIEAHKTYGNRWSMIARFLPGRSENAVKNHWNATRRSLKAKHRLKKKKAAQQAASSSPPGHRQFSILEEYIRGMYPAAPPPVSPPPSYGNIRYNGEVVVSPPSSATAAVAPARGLFFDPPVAGMRYFNASGGSSCSASPPPSSNIRPAMDSMNNAPLLDLNARYGEVAPMHAMMKPAQMMMAPRHRDYYQQQQQQASSSAAYAANLMMRYPSFLNKFMWQQSSSSPAHAAAGGNSARSNAGHGHEYYGGGSDEGGSSTDDVDVVQMASREFQTPSPEEMTLDLARFM